MHDFEASLRKTIYTNALVSLVIIVLGSLLGLVGKNSFETASEADAMTGISGQSSERVEDLRATIDMLAKL